MARINLIAWDNQRGLSHDLRLLRQALEGLGHQVSLTPGGPKRRDGAWAARWLRMRMFMVWLISGGRRPRQFDFNIFLEHVRPACLGLARRNVLIPNPEWFSARDQRWLPRFDCIFTKTRVATEVFAAWGCPTSYIGFLSTDRHNPKQLRQPGFLHLAGASRMKGTERLLALWQRHPEWPLLVVQQSPLTAHKGGEPTAVNIDHRVGYVREASDIAQLQNRYCFHLCLSEAEGWGHYIAEAMGCCAVVITCDAPPMNELVRPDRGLLVKAREVTHLNAARRYCFDEADLEMVIQHAVAMADDKRHDMQARAREWFLANNAGFPARLAAALQPLL